MSAVLCKSSIIPNCFLVAISFNTLTQTVASHLTTIDLRFLHSSGITLHSFPIVSFPIPRFSRQRLLYSRLMVTSLIHHMRPKCIIPSIGENMPISAINYHSYHCSYIAEVFAFAKDASTNDTVQLLLDSTFGLVV